MNIKTAIEICVTYIYIYHMIYGPRMLCGVRMYGLKRGWKIVDEAQRRFCKKKS